MKRQINGHLPALTAMLFALAACGGGGSGDDDGGNYDADTQAWTSATMMPNSRGCGFAKHRPRQR